MMANLCFQSDKALKNIKKHQKHDAIKPDCSGSI